MGDGQYRANDDRIEIVNYDTVLPERILRRYRRRRFHLPHWIRQTLATSAFILTGLTLLCALALVVPGKPDPRGREIIRRALARVGTTPPQVTAVIDYRPHGWDANGEAIGKAGVIGKDK